MTGEAVSPGGDGKAAARAFFLGEQAEGEVCHLSVLWGGAHPLIYQSMLCPSRGLQTLGVSQGLHHIVNMAGITMPESDSMENWELIDMEGLMEGRWRDLSL